MDQELLDFLDASYRDQPVWPKPIRLLQGVRRVRAGEAVGVVARAIGTTERRLAEVAGHADPVAAVLNATPDDVTPALLDKTRKNLAGLLLGRAAEIAFEDIYKQEMPGAEFRLIDEREGRTDTDYRLTNGGNKPLYRINIKFFGSTFRRGPELVGLQPNDCFPLATYKIHQALQKQQAEHLPYIFTVVGVPDLNAGAISPAIAVEDVRPLSLLLASDKVTGRRDLEDRAVDRIVALRSPAFRSAYDRIRRAEWFVVSARRADRLLRDKLFERVYAMRIRGFAQQFRGAELDMHLSLANDLMSLTKFLEILRTEGQTRAASKLERGDI